MHTDQYKLHLRSYSEGTHQLEFQLDDSFFKGIDANGITGGDVWVNLELRRTAEVFTLYLEYDGYVLTSCDRCLDPLELDVYSDRELVVKFGSEHREESEKLLILPESDGVLDLSWIMYEDVVLSLPYQRVHEEGECNQTMTHLYHQLSADEPQQTEQTDIVRDEEGIDERWAALKQLKTSSKN